MPELVPLSDQEKTEALQVLKDMKKNNRLTYVSYQWRWKSTGRFVPATTWTAAKRLLLELDGEDIENAVSLVLPSSDDAVLWPVDQVEYTEMTVQPQNEYPTRKVKGPERKNQALDATLDKVVHDEQEDDQNRGTRGHRNEKGAINPKEFDSLLPYLQTPAGRLLVKSALEHHYMIFGDSKKAVLLDGFLKWAEFPVDHKLGMWLFEQLRIASAAQNTGKSEAEVRRHLQSTGESDPLSKFEAQHFSTRGDRSGYRRPNGSGRRGAAKPCKFCQTQVYGGKWSQHAEQCSAHPQLCTKCRKWFPEADHHRC